MVQADPKNARVTLPDTFLTAIGKVCVQSSMLECVLELTIINLSGMNIWDPRSKIMLNHLAWPVKIDIFSSLANSLMTDHPHLKAYEAALPLLKKAQEGRNRIVHGFWGIEDDGTVKMLRSTSRGKLKTQMDAVTVKEIEEVVNDIHKAAAATINLVLSK